jgi:sugar phosphate isomerase/epimerase
MHIGFITSYSEERVAFAARAGFDCLEISVDPGSSLDLDKLSDRDIGEVAAVFRKHTLAVGTLICSVNHLHGDTAKRAENNRYFEKALKICRKLGAGIVATNAWGDHEAGPARSMETYRAVFARYASIAEAEGVRIAIENCPQIYGYHVAIGNIGYSPEMWEAMFDAVPSAVVGLEFDPSHLVFLQIDYLKALRDFGDRVYSFHAKDTEISQERLGRYGYLGRQLKRDEEKMWYGGPGWWRYRMPGWGQVDWPGIMRVLADVGYAGPLIIEHEDPVFSGARHDEGLRLGLKYLRQFMVDR